MQLPVSGCNEMLAQMKPELMPDTYIYCTTTDQEVALRLMPEAKAMFVETEGWTLILKTAQAEQHGFNANMPMALITMSVYSALEGVGLTAAVSTQLAKYQIPSNIAAAYHHDHIFIPYYLASKAMRLLQELQQSATAALEQPASEPQVAEKPKK